MKQAQKRPGWSSPFAIRDRTGYGGALVPGGLFVLLFFASSVLMLRTCSDQALAAAAREELSELCGPNTSVALCSAEELMDLVSETEDPALRLHLTRELASRPSRMTFDVLRELLDDPEKPIRFAATEGLRFVSAKLGSQKPAPFTARLD